MGTEVWLDPTEAETHLSTGTLVLACMPALETVSSIWQTGSMTPNDVLTVSTSADLFAGFDVTKSSVFESLSDSLQ